MPCASRRKVPGCVTDVRIEVSSAAWSKHWRQCVWLTCPTRATLASRCSKMTARKLPRCGAGARTKSTSCDLSSFGPALFEIWWPDIYLCGPYGPVKDKMSWPERARRSEKCGGPVLMSRAAVSLTSRQRPPTRCGQRPHRHTKVVPSGAATCRLSGGFFEIKKCFADFDWVNLKTWLLNLQSQMPWFLVTLLVLIVSAI